MSKLEIDATIKTQDVAVMAECPNCGSHIECGISFFDNTDLWYGQESITCPSCKTEYTIAHVERDV